ncbi:C5a anaphylatoxin chemotactic receptor 1-like [Rhinoderma darwinii]|uniref:C5a anaphylatoxin chemotactic receptor 1-like n=1 Tax=Rhinoderma darwinii TaxID=43563 RepID=UPI003F67F213
MELNYSNSADYDYEYYNDPVSGGTHLITVYYGVALFLNILVVVLGIPGNGLVMWITSFEMKRSVNTIWFLNLAVADLLCCLSGPFIITHIILGYWPLGLFTCRLIPSILLINMFASVLLLTMISVDRCALVMKPVWCQNNRTVAKAYVACAIMWILALILSSPSFIFRNIIEYKGKELCVQDYTIIVHDHRQRVENIIVICRLLIGFIFPFLVIVTCYSILMYRVKERFTHNTKTMKVVLTVIIGFFVCWLPYHVAGLILALHRNDTALYQSTEKVDQIFIAIAFMNSCINPIIYVLLGQDFKSKFKKSISLILKNVLAEDVSQSHDSRKSKSMSETKNTDTFV